MSWKKVLKDNRVILLSFVIPLLIMGIAYALHGIYPGGTRTILICDMNGQYLDFHSALHQILTRNKSILYSWEGGMGLNFLGLYAYYLSSPFSFLILFFSKQNLTDALWLITLLKIGSSGLTMAIFLRSWGKEYNTSIVLFSVLYALMSYSIVYTFNIMWLDGVILLPLVLLGAEKILKENRFFLFLITLIVMILSNFYIAYMVGLFSLLYLIVRFFCYHPWEDRKLLARKLLIFCSAAVLAVGFTAFIWIPTFFALRHGQGGPEFSIFSWNIKFVLFDLLSKLLLGGYDTLTSRGLPNIFSGLLPLLLLPLFFVSERIALKERLLYITLFIILVLSFNFYNLDIMWHGFDKPDWFPYRYSFLFSFLMVTLSFRMFNKLQSSDIRKVFKISLVWLILILMVQKFDYPYLSDKMIMINVFLIAIYVLCLLGLNNHKGKKKKFILFILVSVILMESSLHSWYLVKRMNSEFGYKTRVEYRRTLDPLEEIIAKIEARDNGFYRLDRIGGRTFNDPLNLDYRGITHFSSMSNKDLHFFLRQLGFLSTAGYKSVNFAGSTPVTESFLGVKYVISARDKGLGYEEILREGDYKAFANQYSLPLGFMVSPKLKNLDLDQDNPFVLQNDLINLSQGRDRNGPEYQDFFIPLEPEKVESRNVVIAEENGVELYKKGNNGEDGWVEFTLVNPRDQQIYACFDSIHITTLIYLNDESIGGYLPVNNKRIIDLGFHREGEILRLKILWKQGQFALKGKYFYGLSADSLAKAINPLQGGEVDEDTDKFGIMNITEFRDTMIRGTVKAREDVLLFTSIPYDPGWTVTVDGQETSVIKIGDSLIAVKLAEGEHTLEFNFFPPGLKQGLLISGLSLALILVLPGLAAIRKN